MLIYLKENGYPMTIKIHSTQYEEVMEDDEIWYGFESTVMDENDEKITTFIHGDYRSRINWCNGFFAGIKYIANENL